jgi:hypothetical protein
MTATTTLPEIRFTDAFNNNRHLLPPASELFGFFGEVLVQGTHPFRMALPMQKEMPLEEIIKPALAEVKKRHCILDKIVFTAARVTGKGEKFEAKIITNEPAN